MAADPDERLASAGEFATRLEESLAPVDEGVTTPVTDRGDRARAPLPAPLPEGVVTFQLTDVEGSSRLWEEDAEAMRAALVLHDDLLDRAVAATGGVRPVEQGEGDSAVVAFAEASPAVACALELQRGLWAADWPAGCELRVRVALHSGEALLRDRRYYLGPTLNRCARLRALALRRPDARLARHLRAHRRRSVRWGHPELARRCDPRIPAQYLACAQGPGYRR